MRFKCPSCAKPLYNRRRATCECCGALIPDSLRLTGKQRQRLEEMRERETKEHRAFMERDISTGGSPGGVDLPGA